MSHTEPIQNKLSSIESFLGSALYTLFFCIFINRHFCQARCLFGKTYQVFNRADSFGEFFQRSFHQFKGCYGIRERTVMVRLVVQMQGFIHVFQAIAVAGYGALCQLKGAELSVCQRLQSDALHHRRGEPVVKAHIMSDKDGIADKVFKGVHHLF